jgi:hypothetical protein
VSYRVGPLNFRYLVTRIVSGVAIVLILRAVT